MYCFIMCTFIPLSSCSQVFQSFVVLQELRKLEWLIQMNWPQSKLFSHYTFNSLKIWFLSKSLDQSFLNCLLILKYMDGGHSGLDPMLCDCRSVQATYFFSDAPGPRMRKELPSLDRLASTPTLEEREQMLRLMAYVGDFGPTKAGSPPFFWRYSRTTGI